MPTQWIEQSKLKRCATVHKDIDTALEYLRGYKPLMPVESDLNKAQLRYVKTYLYNAIVELDQMLAMY